MGNGIDIVDYTYLQERVIPRVAVKWYSIGIQLQIESFRLDNIRIATSRINEQCLEMLGMWLQRGTSGKESHHPTWGNMHKAMIANGLIAAAERLKHKLEKHKLEKDKLEDLDIN